MDKLTPLQEVFKRLGAKPEPTSEPETVLVFRETVPVVTPSVPTSPLAVVVQKWEESERGWGTRPDGYSVHLTESDRIAFIAEYWARMPSGPAPDEYERPDGTPYLAEVAANKVAEFREAINGKKGLRFFDRNYPGNGGTDGWKPTRF
jgi:hypothetical protein